MSLPSAPHAASGSGRTRTNQFLLVTALSLATVSVLLLLAAGVGSRLAFWSFRTGFVIMRYGAWLGLAAALAGCVAVASSCRLRVWKTVLIAGLAIAIGIAAFTIPYSWKLAAGRLPKIHDISTDTVNPPRFVAIAPLRKNAMNPLEYGGTGVAAQQIRAYPDIKTMTLTLPTEQAFRLALETAQRMGWNIVATNPGEGRIEANDTTFWFGFTDDIVIRIAPFGRGSQVDIRSVSRVGLSDVGTNARRIRKFTGMLSR
jgi:uncharacterized protein (DUF1499 family)